MPPPQQFGNLDGIERSANRIPTDDWMALAILPGAIPE
jgi:hypothetical protein